MTWEMFESIVRKVIIGISLYMYAIMIAFCCVYESCAWWAAIITVIGLCILIQDSYNKEVQ